MGTPRIDRGCNNAVPNIVKYATCQNSTQSIKSSFSCDDLVDILWIRSPWSQTWLLLARFLSHFYDPQLEVSSFSQDWLWEVTSFRSISSFYKTAKNISNLPSIFFPLLRKTSTTAPPFRSTVDLNCAVVKAPNMASISAVQQLWEAEQIFRPVPVRKESCICMYVLCVCELQ